MTMAAFRFTALLALVASATAFAPSGSLPNRAVSNTARNDMLGGFDLASVTALSDSQLIGAGVAVLAAAAATVGDFAIQGDKKPEPVVVVEEEPEPEPIDVSIPYDAAARLKFEAWLNEEDVEAANDEATYQKFKAVYENLASAEATVSRYTRELDALKK